MYKEDEQDMKENVLNFGKEYMDKFSAGSVEHGGKFRDIGLLDQVKNAKEEALDLWSYISAIERQVDLIRFVVGLNTGKEEENKDLGQLMEEIRDILNGKKDERK